MKRIRNGEAMNGQANGKNHSENPYRNGSAPTVNSKDHANGAAVRVTEELKPPFSFLQRTLVPLFLMVCTPPFIIIMWYTIVKCDGSYLEMGRRLTANGISEGVHVIWNSVHVTSTVTIATLVSYMVWAIALMKLLPGPLVKGPLTPKGNVPVYKDNGFSAYIVTLVAFVALTCTLKVFGFSTSIVYDKYDEFLCTLHIFSLFFCVFLYLKGVFAPSSSDCGASGNPVFDYYWGTELYPRVWGIDIKVLTNCRFGMTVWPLVAVICWLKSYELHGFVDSMFVCTALQLVYFTKFFWWETGYMRTIDIMLDRAGFYICWGCLVFIPGIYCSTSLYMVQHPVKLGPFLSAAILFTGLAAIWINYLADMQKQDVRASDGKCVIWGRKPEVIRALYTLESGEERQSLLLVSGYWGLARHFHYIPELVLAFCWCLPGLFTHVMPYSYFIWLSILLVHRTYRDDNKCRNKYGAYWKQYCSRVPCRMIPFLY